MAMTAAYKPMVGRLFAFKNMIQTKEFPPNVLVVDENHTSAAFFDENGVMVWVSKFFFRSQPLPFPHFDDETTLTDTIVLIGKLNELLAEATKAPLDAAVVKEMRTASNKAMVSLRKLATKSIFSSATCQEEPKDTDKAQ